ncbi:hypothetical protein [Streptomyces tendae]|uniref:hypothetical protein n=1 Tax=Streptomyces tendae TaxID=1932 RepID=UPI003D702CDA
MTSSGSLHAVLPVVGAAADGSPVVRLGSGATAPAPCVRFVNDQGAVIAEYDRSKQRDHDRVPARARRRRLPRHRRRPDLAGEGRSRPVQP